MPPNFLIYCIIVFSFSTDGKLTSYKNRNKKKKKKRAEHEEKRRVEFFLFQQTEN
jgi:hypothetical protein